jgi:hypothetical protein
MPWKIEIEDEPCSANLLIGPKSRVVIVFVIGIEIEVSAEWQQTACVDACVTPLSIPAGMEEFDAGIRPGMIGVNCETVFHGSNRHEHLIRAKTRSSPAFARAQEHTTAMRGTLR